MKFKILIYSIFFMLFTSLYAVSNKSILQELDYHIDSEFSEKVEIEEFSNYYNISISQVNIYKVYLDKIKSNLRYLDRYLNFLTKKKLFLEKISPLNVLSMDDYKTMDDYQKDLFKIIKKQEIDRIMNPEKDYRKLFIFMIGSELEIHFWNEVMMKGFLNSIIDDSPEEKNDYYKKAATEFVNNEIKALGGFDEYTKITKIKIGEIIKYSSSSTGTSVPRDRTRNIPDDWSKGDKIRLSNYLKEVFKGLEIGDIFLVDNGNGIDMLGYYDHSVIVGAAIENADPENPNPSENTFVGAWASTGVTHEKRYIYHYVYLDENNPLQDDFYERIRKPRHSVNWGRIDTSALNRRNAAYYAESKLGYEYGISNTCNATNNNYTCSGLIYCAYDTQGVDIDGDANGAAYPDDFNESNKFHTIKIINYDHYDNMAKFKCPETISAANSQYLDFYNFGVWNYNCPAHGTSECQEDYDECVRNGGNVYSDIGYEGECSWESCGHTNKACEASLYWGELNQNGLNEYMLGRVFNELNYDKTVVSVCSDSLFSKHDFPLLDIASCVGPNITGGTENQDYVDVMHQNCTQEEVDEWCPEGVSGLGLIPCALKLTECAGYADAIRNECPYVYNIRTYGCDVDNTDGLSELLSKYKDINCKNISIDNTNHEYCSELSSEIYDLCPTYIIGDYEQW